MDLVDNNLLLVVKVFIGYHSVIQDNVVIIVVEKFCITVKSFVSDR